MIPLCVYQSFTQLTLPLLLGEKKVELLRVVLSKYTDNKEKSRVVEHVHCTFTMKKKTPEFAVSDFLI